MISDFWQLKKTLLTPASYSENSDAFKWAVSAWLLSLWPLTLFCLGLYQLWATQGEAAADKIVLIIVLFVMFAGLEALLLRRFFRYGRQAVFAAFVCCILVSVSGPARLNALQTPKTEHFTGLISQENPQTRGIGTDTYTYLAKIRSGFEGQWLYRNRYTEEIHPPVPLFSFHLALGQALKRVNLEPTQGLMVSVALFSLLPLALLWLLSGCLISEPNWRTLAVFSALFGLGWSSLQWVTGLIPKTEDYFQMAPPDLVVPEFTAFQLLSRPHWALALVCMLSVLYVLVRPKEAWLQKVLVAFAVIVLAQIHPFDYLQLALISLIFLCTEMGLFKSMPVKTGLLLMLCGAFGIVPAAYNWYLLHSNEVLEKTLIETNVLHSPGILALIVGFGSTAILLLPAIYLHLRRQIEWQPALRLLWIWLLVGLVLAYAPFSFQRRFLMALYIPAALLAVFYLRHLLLQKHSVLKALLVSLFIISLLPSTLRLMNLQCNRLKLSYSQELEQMFNWMNQNQSQEKLVFSQAWLGAMIPAFTRHRVWVGHWSETLDYEGKRQLASQFWHMPQQDQQRFLDVCPAELFLLGPEDAGDVSDLNNLGLSLAYRSGDYRLYQRSISKSNQP